MTGNLAEPGVYPTRPITTSPIFSRKLLKGDCLGVLARVNEASSHDVPLSGEAKAEATPYAGISVNAAFRLGAKHVGRLRAVGDIKVSETNSAAEVLTPRRLPYFGHIAQLANMPRIQVYQSFRYDKSGSCRRIQAAATARGGRTRRRGHPGKPGGRRAVRISPFATSCQFFWEPHPVNSQSSARWLLR